MLLYAGDSERKEAVLGAVTCFVFSIGARPRPNRGQRQNRRVPQALWITKNSVR